MTEPVYLVGGGPSLAGFDWARLRGKTWVGVNLAYLHEPTWAVAKDVRWMERFAHEPLYRAIPGRRLWVGDLTRYQPPPWVEHVPARLDWSPRLEDGLCAQADTGLTALNLADILAGPGGRVVLVGFDFGHPSGKEGNYHDAYPWRRRSASVYDRFLDWWAKFVPCLRAEVVNATPGGRLRLFPRVDLDAVLDRNPAGLSDESV